MSGWVRYLRLQAKAKTGLSSAVLVWGVIALISLAVTLGFLTIAAFIWLAERYDALTAALLLGGVFLVVAIIAGICCLVAHRSAITRARLELAERKNMPWLEPSFLAAGLQVGSAIGWRKLLPLAAVAFFAAGLVKEWTGRDKPREEDAGEDDSED